MLALQLATKGAQELDVKGLPAGKAVLAKTPVEDDLREDDIRVAPFSHPDQQVGVLSRPEARVVPVDSDEGVASTLRPQLLGDCALDRQLIGSKG